MGKVLGIYGAGGLGRELLELATIINRAEHKWDAFVFIVDEIAENQINGIDVVRYKDIKTRYSDLEVVIGLGEPSIREAKYRCIKKDNIDLTNLIHPDVNIPASVSLGKGIVIQESCFISVNTTIKDNVLLQTRCAIGHDCLLKEGCIISTFDSLAGGVTIGKYTYIGMGACIKEKTNVGDYSIISMGAMVFNDIPDEAIVVGNPGRVMKKNEEHHVFKHK